MEYAHPNMTVSSFATFVGKWLYGCGTRLMLAAAEDRRSKF
jgi:hypothetical protein